MRNSLTFTESDLIVEPVGIDKLWSFTGHLQVPWSQVRGATHDPGMKSAPKGWRSPGLRHGGKLSGPSTPMASASYGMSAATRTLLSSSQPRSTTTG